MRSFVFACVAIVFMVGPAWTEELKDCGLASEEMKRVTERSGVLESEAIITHLTKCLEAGTVSGEIKAFMYLQRARAYAFLELYEPAINDLDQLVSLDPKNEFAYSLRGLIYYRLQQHEQAINDFAQLIGLSPKSSQYHLMRGLSYAALDQNVRAIEDFDQAILLKPDDFNAYNHRGNFYQKQKRYREAIENYDQAIMLAPRHDDAYSYKAWIHATSSSPEWRNGREAVKLAEKALKLASDGNQPHLHSARAAAYAEDGRFNDAITAAEFAIFSARIRLRDFNEPNLQIIADLEAQLALYRQGKPFRY